MKTQVIARIIGILSVEAWHPSSREVRNRYLGDAGGEPVMWESPSKAKRVFTLGSE